jgi:uncharacterized membrane protein YczE
MLIGLNAFGMSIALQVRANLGLDPWDVFHQGIARRTGLSIGTCVIIVGAVVLAVWIPLRLRPGIGTISNVVLIGLAADVALRVLPGPSGITLRVCVSRLRDPSVRRRDRRLYRRRSWSGPA